MLNKMKYAYTVVILFFVNIGFWMAAKVMRHAVIVRGLDPNTHPATRLRKMFDIHFKYEMFDGPDFQKQEDFYATHPVIKKMQDDIQRRTKALQKFGKVGIIKQADQDAQEMKNEMEKLADKLEKISALRDKNKNTDDLIEALKDEDYQLVVPPPLPVKQEKLKISKRTLNKMRTKTKSKKKTKKASKTTGKKKSK